MKLIISSALYINNDLHAEFTELTVGSIKTSHKYELMLVENFCAPEYTDRMSRLGNIVKNPKGNSIPGAWNLAIKKGIEENADYILIPNNDILFHPECIDNLVSFAQEHPDWMIWTAAEWTGDQDVTRKVIRGDWSQVVYDHNHDDHPHFSCFMVSPESIKRLKDLEDGTGEPYPGLFDENLRVGYFEDGDMHQRVIRANSIAGKTGSALFYHFGSRTIKTDDELNQSNRETYEYNRQYIHGKWGFDPHGRVITNDDPIRFVYQKPFNKL